MIQAMKVTPGTSRCVNNDTPYDEFLLEQLAGDLIEPNDPSAPVATGFLGAGPWDYSGFITAIQGTAAARGTRHRDLDNMLTTMMATTVGFTKDQYRAIGQSHHVGAPQHLPDAIALADQLREVGTGSQLFPGVGDFRFRPLAFDPQPKLSLAVVVELPDPWPLTFVAVHHGISCHYTRYRTH
jgi:hypothetical protein